MLMRSNIVWLHDPQCIGKADTVRARFDGGIADFDQVIKIRAGGIFGRVTDLQSQTLCVTYMLLNDRQRFFSVLCSFASRWIFDVA